MTADDHAATLERLYPGRWLQLLTTMDDKGTPARDPAVIAKRFGMNIRESHTICWLAGQLESGGQLALVIPPGLIVLECENKGASDWVHSNFPTSKVPIPRQHGPNGKRHFVFRLPVTQIGPLTTVPQIEPGPCWVHSEDYTDPEPATYAHQINLLTSGTGCFPVEPSPGYKWLVPLPDTLDEIPEIPAELLRELLEGQVTVAERLQAIPYGEHPDAELERLALQDLPSLRPQELHGDILPPDPHGLVAQINRSISDDMAQQLDAEMMGTDPKREVGAAYDSRGFYQAHCRSCGGYRYQPVPHKTECPHSPVDDPEQAPQENLTAVPDDPDQYIQMLEVAERALVDHEAEKGDADYWTSDDLAGFAVRAIEAYVALKP